MSIATAHFKAAFDHAGELLGDTVKTKRPADVDYVDLTGAIVGNERTERRDSNDGGIDHVRLRDIVASEAKIPGGVARMDLFFKVGDNRYAVEDFIRVDAGYVSFKVRRVEASEVSRKGYRGNR